MANASWRSLRELALLVDGLGYDSLWVPHHLRAFWRPEDPYLEGWQVLGACAALTSRVRIGSLVTPVGFLHPSVLAKMAATLDHVSGGRAILGLGAGWYEAEYTAYGLRFGSNAERVSRLAETAAIARSLLDGPSTSFAGKHYRLADALAEPKPLQRRLPLLIGGGGERGTLRAVARYADVWNGFGAPEEIARKLEALRGHCATTGRDPSEITATVAFRPVVIRDSSREIEARFEEIRTAQHAPEVDRQYALTGDAETVARRLAEYCAVGVGGFIAQMHAPFDRQSIERLIREVKPRLVELVA